jgi:glycosyltransferase involved in cell wall biosynthesis
MKKILLPYLSRSGNNIHSKTTVGGIEKFTKNLYEIFPDSIPVEITSEDRKAKKTKKIYLDAIHKHRPDLIIVNDIDQYWLHPQIELGIPTIAIAHEPLVRDIRYIAWWKGMQKFIDAGGHLYFVSEYQQKFHDGHVKRITGSPLNGVKGTIHSGFADGNEVVPEKTFYDAVTIGRTDLTKNPFLLHKKLANSDKISCVLTNKENFQHSENQKKYWDDNLHWKDPQHTHRGLSHQDTLNVMSSAKCYVSTMPVESWGITCMEALLHGVPVILLCDKSGEHASEVIPARDWHCKKMDKNCTPDELIEEINACKLFTYMDRLEISGATKQKHSKKKWVDKWNKMVYNTTFNIEQKSTLTEFMQ